MAVSTIDPNGLNVGQFGNRNMVINGSMAVAQRGTSFTSQTGSGYFIDRFRVVQTDDATWTYSQEADAPEGFANSFKALVTTVDGSNDASDSQFIRHSLEGQDLQHLKKGTADAQSLTLSFWVKCSGTGTFIAELNDPDNNRTISKAYTINAAGTWEYKTVTFEGDTTGTLDNDNAESLRVHWWYGAGSDYTSGTLATSWQSRTNANRAVGSSVNIPTTSGGYFQITGVQLEVGDTATPFEHRSYGDELARCQRYYYRLAGVTAGNSGDGAVGTVACWDSDSAFGTIYYPQYMRAAPSMSYGANLSDFKIFRAGNQYTPTSISTTGRCVDRAGVLFQNTGNIVAGQAAWVRIVDASNGYLAFDAEL